MPLRIAISLLLSRRTFPAIKYAGGVKARRTLSFRRMPILEFTDRQIDSPSPPIATATSQPSRGAEWGRNEQPGTTHSVPPRAHDPSSGLVSGYAPPLPPLLTSTLAAEDYASPPPRRLLRSSAASPITFLRKSPITARTSRPSSTILSLRRTAAPSAARLTTVRMSRSGPAAGAA